MQEIVRKNYTSLNVLLIIAGVYHLLWGCSILIFPNFFFFMEDIPVPNYMELWQITGFYTAIFGVAYFMASFNPIRHWRIVFLGFITKLLIVLSFLWSYIHDTSSFYILYKMILVNHGIWLFPFGLVLYYAYRQKYIIDNELIIFNNSSADELLEIFTTNKGDTIKDSSNVQPVLLVFLRHIGCVFCKETLMNIKKLKDEIDLGDTKIILVNMTDEKNFSRALLKYDLSDTDFVCDPESILYKAFKLKRGSLTQLFGLKVLFRAFQFWLKTGDFVTVDNDADVYQMPGIFLIYKGEIIKQYVYESVADIPSLKHLTTLDAKVPS